MTATSRKIVNAGRSVTSIPNLGWRFRFTIGWVNNAKPLANGYAGGAVRSVGSTTLQDLECGQNTI